MKVRVLRLIGWPAAALVALAVVAVVLLTSSPGENLVRGWLERRLSSEFGVPVSIERFETNLWSRAQMFQLSVGSMRDGSADTILYVKYLRIGYAIPDLLGSTVTLKALIIDSVELSVSLDSLGRLGIPAVDYPPTDTVEESAGGFAIDVDTFSLSGLGLGYVDTEIPLSMLLRGATATARSVVGHGYSGHLIADSVCATYDSLDVCLRGFGVAASYRDHVIEFASIEAMVDELSLNGAGRIVLNDSVTIALSSSIQGVPDNLLGKITARYGLPLMTMNEIHVEAEVNGVMSQPSLTMNVKCHDIATPYVAIPSATLQARYFGDKVSVDSLSMECMGGTVTAGGRFSLDSTRPSSLHVELARIDMAAVWQALYGKSSPYSGNIAGHITVDGSGYVLSDWSAEAQLEAKNLRYNDKPIPDLGCKVDFNDETIVLLLRHGDDVVRATAAIREDRIEGTFDLSVPDLAAVSSFLDQPELSGRLWASGTISGTTDSPVLSSTVGGSGILYHNFPVDTLSVECCYRDSTLFFEKVSWAGELGDLSTSPHPFGVDSIGGRLKYAGEMSGSLDSLTGSLWANLFSPQYGSYSADSLNLRATIDGPAATLTTLDVFRDQMRLEMRGWFDTVTSAGEINAQLWQRNVDDPGHGERQEKHTPDIPRGLVNGRFSIPSDSTLSADIEGSHVWLGIPGYLLNDSTIKDGSVGFALTFDGSIVTPRARLAVQADSVLLSGFYVDSVRAAVVLSDTALLLERFAAFALGQVLTAGGSIDLHTSADGFPSIEPEAPVSGFLTAENFDLAALQPFLPTESNLSGQVSAALDLDGLLSSPQLKGRLAVDNGRFCISDDATPIDGIRIGATFSDTVLTVDSSHALVSGVPLILRGTLTTSTFEQLAANLELAVSDVGTLSVSGTVSRSQVQLDIVSDDMDLAVFNPLLSSVDSLSGTLRCRLAIEGEPLKPQLDGFIGVQALSFRIPGRHVALSDGTAAVRFDGNRVMLDTVRTLLNGGRINLSGFVSHADWDVVDAQLALKADSLSFYDPESHLLAVEQASLNYGKRGDKYVLEGDVQLGESRLTAGLRPQSVLPWVQSVESVEWEMPEVIARTRLDVRIRESDRLWVDNNLARIRLHAELGVIGTLARPNFTGLLNVEEGYLLYLDRRFQVNQGAVFFNDPVRFNPEITLDAGTQVTTYRRTTATTYNVYFRAEGLLDQLQYGFSSEPPLDNPDIVALLTLGATRTELAGNGEGKNQSGTRQILVDRAAVLTSQRISAYVSRKAGSLFGFDEFTLQGNLFQFDDTWGPQLVASRRLSKRVDMTYSTTVGHLNDQSIRLGYRLTARLSLQGETDQAGRAGIDLKYGLSFK